MPEKRTMERARQNRREGKAPSTQAGQFVREAMHQIRAGRHGARSTKQAIAIGLSKPRWAGLKSPQPAGRRERARLSPEEIRRSATLASCGLRTGRMPADHEPASKSINKLAHPRRRKGWAKA